MTRHFAVVQQIILPGDADHCWRYISNPRLVSEWFADVDQMKLGEPIRFDFADGDFFKATILELDAPTFMRIVWKFMGVGTPSDISLFLTPVDGKTEVTVLDRGEYSERMVAELREGWRDFLSRLERTVNTGENSRYRWRMGDGDGPDVSLEAVVHCDKAQIARTLTDIPWWRDAFPQSHPMVETQGDGDQLVQAVFAEPEWLGHETKATVAIETRRDGLGVAVTHIGWSKLQQEIQLQERKRFAGLWALALCKLEHRFGGVGEAPATSGCHALAASA